MKRTLLLLLVFVLTLTLLAGCGGGKTPSQGGSTGQDSQSEKPGDTSPSGSLPESSQQGGAVTSGRITYEPGGELQSFTDFCADQLKPFEAFLSDLRDHDNEHLGDPITLEGGATNASQCVLYGSVDWDFTGNGRAYKKLPVDKTESGGKITWKAEGETVTGFGGAKTVNCSLTVTLDTAANTFTADEKSVTDDTHRSRTVVETVVLGDGTMLTAYSSFYEDELNGRAYSGTYAHLFKINADKGEYLAVYGTMKDASIDFSAPSIVGAGDLDMNAYDGFADLYATVKISGGNIEITYA